MTRSLVLLSAISLLLLLSCKNKYNSQLEVQQIPRCQLDSSKLSIESLDELLEKRWTYNYSFDDKGCFTGRLSEEISTGLFFYKCDKDTLSGPPSLFSGSYYKFHGVCYNSSDNDSTWNKYFTIVREVKNGELELLYYGHTKGEFSLSKISRDTIVIKIYGLVIDNEGKEHLGASHVYLN